MTLHRIKAVSKKEFKQLARDKKLLFVIFFFPVLLLIVFGYAINFDVKHVKIAVLDYDHSYESRLLISKLNASVYFDLTAMLNSPKEIDEVINKKEAQAVLTIPPDFARALNRQDETAHLQFVIDGVDGNTATIIKNYVSLFTMNFSEEINSEFLAKIGKSYRPLLEILPRFQFNSDLKSTKFLMPGLIAMILIVTAVVTVSLSLVREKERGTSEQIRVSSINSFELITGKSIPYILISLLNAGMVLAAGYLFFETGVAGSWLLLTLSVLIFIVASISMGIFISVIADSQQVAFQVSSLVSLLPSLILSGFIFPIDSMPVAIRFFTNLTPATFFIKALRAIMLKGVGLSYFGEQLIYLSLFPVFFFAISTLINRKKMRKA